MAAELEGQNISYDTEIAIGPEHYAITYFIYATTE